MDSVWERFGYFMKEPSLVYFPKSWDDPNGLGIRFVDFKKEYGKEFGGRIPKYDAVKHRNPNFTGFVSFSEGDSVHKFIFEGRDRYTQIERESKATIDRYSIFLNDGFVLSRHYSDSKFDLYPDEFYDPDFVNDSFEKSLAASKILSPSLTSVHRSAFFDLGYDISVNFKQIMHNKIYLTFCDKRIPGTAVHVDVSGNVGDIVKVENGKKFYSKDALSSLENLWMSYGHLPVDEQSEFYFSQEDFNRGLNLSMRGMCLEEILRLMVS